MNMQLKGICRRLDEAEAMNLALGLLLSSLAEQMHVDRPSLLQAMTHHYDLLEHQEHAGDVTPKIARARRAAMDRVMQAFCLDQP